jgi:predicted nucleotidyltransferase
VNQSALPSDLDLVVLFGSRAKGSASESSDWDLAVLLQPNPQAPLRLFGLDLSRSSYLLQRVVAEDGQLLFERQPGMFAAFKSRARRQWADWTRRQAKLELERAGAVPE